MNSFRTSFCSVPESFPLSTPWLEREVERLGQLEENDHGDLMGRRFGDGSRRASLCCRASLIRELARHCRVIQLGDEQGFFEGIAAEMLDSVVLFFLGALEDIV